MTDVLFDSQLQPAFDALDAALPVEGPSDVWDRQVIDQAITVFADRGVPFSANDIRPMLPDVRKSLLGGRFLAALRSGRLRKVGFVQSTDPGSHGAWVKSYVGVRGVDAA